jgi:hypothetical protein
MKKYAIVATACLVASMWTTSASQASPNSTGRLAGSALARSERQPAGTSPGTLSVVAGRRVYNLSPGPARIGEHVVGQ